MTEHKKLVHQITVPVRWADMDINAHVNNVAFFTYFECARLEWFESVRSRAQRDGQGLVVAQAHCNYRRVMPYPETAKIMLYAGPPGRSSFTLHYDLLSAANDTIQYADGKTVMVWVDRASGKSLPLPDYVREALAPTAIESETTSPATVDRGLVRQTKNQTIRGC